MPPGFLDLRAAVAPAAERLGLDVFLVGGAVRDMVEGRLPSGAWDLVVMDRTGSGAKALAGELSVLWKWREPVSFQRFGTYLVSGPAGPVEISQCGLRSDLTPEADDPLVRDALTRDFTLNALYVKLAPVPAGERGTEVLDPTGRGRKDLDARVLRTPSPAGPIITDDPARILRAARLASTHGYRTSASLSREAKRLVRLLTGISRERVREEMDRLLLGEKPSNGLARLARWGAFEVLMPEIHRMVGFRQRTPHHYPDLFRHTMRVVDRTRPDLTLRWAALLHDCGKPETRSEDGEVDRYLGHESVGAELAAGLLARLRSSKRVTREVTELIRLHMVHYSPQWSDRAVRRFMARCGDSLPLLLELLEADARSMRLRAGKLAALAELRRRVEAMGRIMPPARCPIDGQRVMALLGIGPGPEVGKAKAILSEAVTEGRIGPDPEEAESYLLREWKGPGERRP